MVIKKLKKKTISLLVSNNDVQCVKQIPHSKGKTKSFSMYEWKHQYKRINK